MEGAVRKGLGALSGDPEEQSRIVNSFLGAARDAKSQGLAGATTWIPRVRLQTTTESLADGRVKETLSGVTVGTSGPVVTFYFKDPEGKPDLVYEGRPVNQVLMVDGARQMVLPTDGAPQETGADNQSHEGLHRGDILGLVTPKSLGALFAGHLAVTAVDPTVKPGRTVFDAPPPFQKTFEGTAEEVSSAKKGLEAKYEAYLGSVSAYQGVFLEHYSNYSNPTQNPTKLTKPVFPR